MSTKNIWSTRLGLWDILLLVVFLHPAEGLVLWEKSWHRMSALFSTRHDKIQPLQLQRTKSSLSGQNKTKQNECHVTQRDTIPAFEGRFQIHLTSLINIISNKAHATELAFRDSSTTTMTETNRIKPIEFPELSGFCRG